MCARGDSLGAGTIMCGRERGLGKRGYLQRRPGAHNVGPRQVA